MSTRTAIKGSRLSAGTNFIILFVFCCYFLLPLWWLVVAATKSQGDAINTNALWFSGFQLGTNLTELIQKDAGVFVHWMINSALYAGVGAGVATVTSGMAGYCFSTFKFRGRRILLISILGTVLVPSTVLVLPLFLLFAKLHLVDTVWAFLVPNAVFPFGVYLAYIFCSLSVPDELIEAARMDGAGEFRIYLQIVQPLMLPGLATVFLFAFVNVWNNFMLALFMLQSERLYPVTLGLYEWKSQIILDPQLQVLITTGSLVSVVPLIAAFLCLQRYWRSGLALGALR